MQCQQQQEPPSLRSENPLSISKYFKSHLGFKVQTAAKNEAEDVPRFVHMSESFCN